MGVPAATKSGAQPPGDSSSTPNADISTSSGATGNHIIVKPKLDIPSEKNPMTDDDALLKLIASMPEEVQKDLMDEAEFSRQYCEQNSFLSNYYNCSCFSFKIIGDRIAKGPKPQTFELFQNARYSECVDDAKVAGVGFEKCSSIMTYMPINTQQLNDICECTGRLLAKSYRQSPDPVVSQVENLFTDVLSECRHRVGF